MILAEIVVRARSATGGGCIYQLGCGGMAPGAPVPWDDKRRCDCSGFGMWCCGLSRHQGEEWINTDAMVEDGKTPGGLFEEVHPWDQCKPGNLLVYGRARKGYGHVGVISEADVTGPLKAIHCSSGNFRNSNDAIQETGIGAWRRRPDSIIVRLVGAG